MNAADILVAAKETPAFEVAEAVSALLGYEDAIDARWTRHLFPGKIALCDCTFPATSILLSVHTLHIMCPTPCGGLTMVVVPFRLGRCSRCASILWQLPG